VHVAESAARVVEFLTDKNERLPTSGTVAPEAIEVPGTPITVAVIVSPLTKLALIGVAALLLTVNANATAPLVELFVVAYVPTTVCEAVLTVNEAAAAFAGATEDTTPRPKAATATSATRLKVVFVDICFLSISRSREFP